MLIKVDTPFLRDQFSTPESKKTMLKGLIVGLLTTVNGMTFKQFEGKEYFIDTTKVRVAPDGHELHFIQDANDNIFEWDKTTKLYTHHDESKHHNDDGHHHKLIFNFESGSPPEELQKDDQGHKLIEIVNKKVNKNIKSDPTPSPFRSKKLYCPR